MICTRLMEIPVDHLSPRPPLRRVGPPSEHTSIQRTGRTQLFQVFGPEHRKAWSMNTQREVAVIGGIDFGGNRKPGTPRALDIGFDGVPALNPGIGVDPKVYVV